jgi:RimJ/RimL family protein N-acetyltransferase
MTDKHGRPFTVRRLTPSDRNVLEQMYTTFEPKRGAQGLPPREPLIRRWLDRILGSGSHFGIEVDGELLGHTMLIPMEDGRLELANFLHQSIRNRGIGSATNRVALDEARRLGWDSVWLSVEPSNRAALKSYENAGFRRLPGSLWAQEIEMEADVEQPAESVTT